jgi:hypothetical protein
MQAVSQRDFKPDYRLWLPLLAGTVILLAWHLLAYFTLTTLTIALLLPTIIIYALLHCVKGIRIDDQSREAVVYNPLFGTQTRFNIGRIKEFKRGGSTIKSFSFEIDSGQTIHFYQAGTKGFSELQELMREISMSCLVGATSRLR